MTADEIRAHLDDVQALTATLWGECRGEPLPGQIAVASVIRNRAQNPNPHRFGATIAAVCLAANQFSCWWEPGAPNTTRTYALAEALLDDSPTLPFGDAVVRELHWIAEGIATGALRDNVSGANHYLTADLFDSAACPSWARGATPIARIGAHVFLHLA